MTGSNDRSESTAAPGGGTEAQAKDACLRLLTVRARSRAELEQRLHKRGFAAEVVEHTMERLTEMRLIDDAEFAEQWVHSRHRHSGKGRAVIAQELRNKGVQPADVQRALDTISREDERERAVDLVRRKLRGSHPPADSADRDRLVRRLVGMLARRGFNQSLALDVVRSELADPDIATDALLD
ncbi:MAG: regulatory protein RecX [Aldersonia sp.]|nr:regulatory protein RecX [Aldersonia sp.]